MAIKRITPEEAAALLDQGWKYVDVRTQQEFESGHPDGAYNVPIMNQSGRSLVANPDFASVMTRRFAKGDRLIVGCKSGGRSLRAAGVLASLGFTDVVDMRGGFAGEVGPGGSVSCAGWQSLGLPVASDPQPGRSYRDLRAE